MPMPRGNQSGVVMGIPADYFGTQPRYEDPTIITTTPEPLACNNPDENLRPCLKWFIVTLFVIIFILLISLSFSGLYLTFQNRAPIIQIESITPSNIASTNKTTISTNWHLTFFIENPNNYASIHYKKIRVSVSDVRDKSFSSGNVDDFYQDKKEKGRMNVDIFGLVMDLEKQKMNDVGEMVFSLKLDAVVWLEAKYMNKYWQLLEANCGDVKVQPSMSLTLDGYGRCNVNLK